MEIYDRLFQTENFSHKKNPGWVDTRQAVYLALLIFLLQPILNNEISFAFQQILFNSKKVRSYEKLRNETLGTVY
jgi:hypothetical protein